MLFLLEKQSNQGMSSLFILIFFFLGSVNGILTSENSDPAVWYIFKILLVNEGSREGLACRDRPPLAVVLHCNCLLIKCSWQVDSP